MGFQLSELIFHAVHRKIIMWSKYDNGFDSMGILRTRAGVKESRPALARHNQLVNGLRPPALASFTHRGFSGNQEVPSQSLKMGCGRVGEAWQSRNKIQPSSTKGLSLLIGQYISVSS